MAMENLAQAVERLTAAGYEDAFRAEGTGLRALRTGRVHEPELLTIDEVVRFEGATDPDEEAVVFALKSEGNETRGTYVVSYGIYMDPLDAVMVRRLADRRPRRA
jgi:hypothetical protein